MPTGQRTPTTHPQRRPNKLKSLPAERQGHLAMLSFSLLVSLSFFFGHFVAREIDPGALMVLRFALASAVLFVVLLSMRARPVFRRFWRFLLIGGCMAIYFITMFEALRMTTAISTAAVFTLTPLMAAGFGRLFLHQRPGRWTLSALMVGGAGAVWVIFRADLEALLRFEIGPGETLFVFGSMAHAAVPALSRRFCDDVPPLQTAFATTLGALVVTTLYAAPELVATPFALLPAQVWWVLIYLAVATTAGTFFLVQYASKRLPGSKVMAYTYLVPSWVVFWEVLALGHLPTPALLLGILGTIIALLMLLRDEVHAQ